MIYMFLSNNPSSGEKNSSNLSCLFCNWARYVLIPVFQWVEISYFSFYMVFVSVAAKLLGKVTAIQ